jgi:hypothetical protein
VAAYLHSASRWAAPGRRNRDSRIHAAIVEEASNDSSDQLSYNLCTFCFLSERLIIRVIGLVGKHVGRDWEFSVG